MNPSDDQPDTMIDRPQKVLICGSAAFDTIMVFEGRFREHILPEQLHILNVSFLVPQLRREFGGCAGNIAYNLNLLGDPAVPMATVGRDFGPYREWMESIGLPVRHMTVIDSELTAQAFITTDVENNQITAFHPGAMQYAQRNRVLQAADIVIGIVAPDGRQGMIAHSEQFGDLGIPFIFDPGQGLPMFDAADLDSFIEQANWVAVNDYEWQLLQQKTGWTVRDITRRVEALFVTRGPKGSVIYTLDDEVEIPCAKTSAVVDPTGCGDAYRAGLLHGLLHDFDYQSCGRIAAVMGALKIESRGTQNHRATPEQIVRRVAESFGDDAAAKVALTASR
jgi:adenosine kinase